MRSHDCKQGTDEWLQLRAGIPTASELDNLIAPATLKLRSGDGPHTYLLRKLAERWLGGTLASFRSGEMEQGSLLEEEAIPFFELRIGVDIDRPGFLSTDDGRFGCSPDGLIVGRDMGIEIKCPQPTNHLRWLLEDECPNEHWLQCQGGMFVTGYRSWYFASYCRDFPKLVRVVERDDDAMDAIAEAVASFTEKIEAAHASLVQANGGPRVEELDDHPF